MLLSDQLSAVSGIIAATQAVAAHKAALARTLILDRFNAGDLTNEDIIRAFQTQASTPQPNPQHFCLTPGAASTPLLQSALPEELEELAADVALVADPRHVLAAQVAEAFASTIPSTTGSSGQTERAHDILVNNALPFHDNMTTARTDHRPPTPTLHLSAPRGSTTHKLTTS